MVSRANLFNLARSFRLKTTLSSVISLVVLLGITPLSTAQEYSPISQLGTNEAVCLGGIETVEELQEVFVNDAHTIQQVLDDSGWQGNKSDLDAAIAAGDFQEKSYEPGSKFFWMAAKRKGAGVALPHREWSGKEAFIGYEVKVTSQCQVHTMVIPKICCNLALMSMEPELVDAPLLSVSSSADTMTACTDPGNQLTISAADGTITDAPLDGNGCWSGLYPKVIIRSKQ